MMRFFRTSFEAMLSGGFIGALLFSMNSFFGLNFIGLVFAGFIFGMAMGLAIWALSSPILNQEKETEVKK